MSEPAGISARGRAELARVMGVDRRFVAPQDLVETLGIDADTAAKKLSRWAEDGWVRRVRRGLYIPVPVDAANPAAWSEDPLLVAAEIWSPCYFTGWTAARHWSLTEQVFRATVLKTTGRVRSSPVHLLDHEYLVSHVPDDALAWGTKSVWIADTRVRFAGPARTVVDCFRYRNKVGLDVAMEALRDAVGSRKAGVSEIDRAAEVCRIRTVIAPYLEALSV